MAKKFDDNIFKFIITFLRKTLDIITNGYCVNILPVVSDCNGLYSMISGESLPMPLVYMYIGIWVITVVNKVIKTGKYIIMQVYFKNDSKQFMLVKLIFTVYGNKTHCNMHRLDSSLNTYTNNQVSLC